MEKIINNLMETLNDADIQNMLCYLEEMDINMDFIDMPYIDGSYKTQEQKNIDIVASFMNEILFIQDYRGESASEYSSRLEYVERGGFEKDYFASWLESCSDYPCLNEIKEFCESVDCSIKMWLYAVECGYIEPNDGWDYEPFDLEKARAEAQAIYEARKNIC